MTALKRLAYWRQTLVCTNYTAKNVYLKCMLKYLKIGQSKKDPSGFQWLEKSTYEATNFTEGAYNDSLVLFHVFILYVKCNS